MVLSTGVRVSPPALTFDPLPFDETAVQTVRLENTGALPVDLVSVVVEGAGAFTLPEPIAPGPLSPGAVVAIPVAFTAIDLDSQGRLSILTTDPDAPSIPVPLAGAAAVGALVMSPNPLMVGHTAANVPTEAPLTIENVGHAPVTIDELYLARDEFKLIDPFTLPAVVAPDEALTLDVGFYPDVDGIYEAQLWIGADDPKGAHLVGLRGTAGDDYEEQEGTEEEDAEDRCFEPETGFLEHPQARFLVHDPDQPVVATYINNGGGYVNELSLGAPKIFPIATTHHDALGKTVDLGLFNEGDELLLQVYVRDTGYTYFSGPASRNPDNFPHVAMAYLGDCVWRVGFEDLHYGGDQDFDDVVITLSGGLRIAL
ncbi:MAG: DUF4114 domain-containing protein [Myxococcota bacterium]